MPPRRIKHREGIPKRTRRPKGPFRDVSELKQAVGISEAEKTVCDSADGSRRGEPAAQLYPAGRKCICCGAAISMYNSAKLCSPCDTIIAEWERFPWNRTEIEQRMSKSCLQYVQEKEAKKSRRRANDETSSGSFMRAIGRKNIHRKEK